MLELLSSGSSESLGKLLELLSSRSALGLLSTNVQILELWDPVSLKELE